MITFVTAIFFAWLISFTVTPIVRNFFIKKKWVESPAEKNKKTHNATATTSVPRGGGIPIFLSILITSLFLLPLDKHLIGILTAAQLPFFYRINSDFS
ncbi:hypothetical protein EOM09_05790 [bacterium]|nr:hypothetical protein [bacterium]